MQYYNPFQNKTTVPTTKAPTLPPGTGNTLHYSAPNQMANQRDRYGEVTQIGGLRDPGWSTGATFQANSKIAGLEALKNTMSTANPEDYAAMDEIRNYYRSALADLPGNTEKGISSFDSQSQYGLKNLLSQHSAANAGRGTMGSRQFAGAQGDIVSRSNNDYINGLLRARADALDQAGKINSGLTNVQARHQAEREFQFNQGQALADLIVNYMSMDNGREAQLTGLAAQRDAANKALWGQIIQAGAMAGGTMLAGPAGGMAAGSAAGSMTGPTNTGPVYQGGNGGYSVGSAYGMYR